MTSVTAISAPDGAVDALDGGTCVGMVQLTRTDDARGALEAVCAESPTPVATGFAASQADPALLSKDLADPGLSNPTGLTVGPDEQGATVIIVEHAGGLVRFDLAGKKKG